MKVVKAINPLDKSTEYVLINKDFDIIAVVQKYLNFLKATGKSPNTVKNYCYHLKLYFSFLEEIDIMYNQVSTDNLVAFIQWLKKPVRTMQVDFLFKENSVCENTINTIIAAISSFYQYTCRSENFINPVIYSNTLMPTNGYKSFLIHAGKRMVSKNLLKCRAKKHIVTTISDEKFKLFLNTVKNTRDRLIILLMHEGGLRIGEVLSLWIEDLSLWDKRILIIPRDNLINGARDKSKIERFIDISSELCKLIDEYLLFHRPDCFDTNHLFVVEKGKNTGTPLSYNTVYKMFKYYEKKADIKLSPHVLRHTHATSLIKAGWDASFVQKRLGHAQVQTTINTYIHLNDEDLKNAYEKYEQRKKD
ncbi:MAG: tyrosine-type recombinase/integrase [Clostridiaceae bacterium]